MQSIDSAGKVEKTGVEAAKDSLSLRFLRQAPFLPAATDLAVTSCPIDPWPHQLRVFRHVTRRFPESFLFADEVGLGKTIEAGLVLRQLVISGRARRALLLVPKGILRQWQEELYEKLVLEVPRYEAGRFFDVRGQEIVLDRRLDNPWNQFPLLLASSQLAKQRQRRQEILAADPWDVVLLDEAHHARRRASGSGSPNQLLELLAGRGGQAGLKDRCRCLYLLSATPMQVHAIELWDLLKLLGMGGRWGANENEFLRYFEELRRPFEARDWSSILAMSDEVMASTGSVDVAFAQWARETLGDGAEAVERLLLGGIAIKDLSTKQRQEALNGLSAPQRHVLDRGLRRHTPLRALAWRHTRGLLRAYRQAGLIDAAVPKRSTRNVWITLRPREKDLYDRIESFVSDFFQRYEARRKGLGFAMTLYRRRLTSSFYAVRRSLERRLLVLRRLPGDPEATTLLLAPDDTESDPWEPSSAVPEQGVLSLFDDLTTAPSFSDEIVFIEDFLERLNDLPGDSKLDQLQGDLDQLLAARDRVLVFTQYTDTMDFLRQELVESYGQALACYSGRGGEVWHQDTGWSMCPKDRLKERFRRGEIKVLLCTEAAGEGLNLQTCGAMIHFDMPWNPMRVEQRIGRIDRIGQLHDEVWIRSYFYRDTVEAEVYRRLSHRIGWFEEVVGTLQPILHNVGETIRRLAMLPASRRERQLREEIQRLDDQWDVSEGSTTRILDGCFAEEGGLAENGGLVENGGLAEDASDLDARMTEAIASPLEPPVTSRELETVLTKASCLACRWTAVDGMTQTYDLDWRGAVHRVTFEPAVFERNPYSVSLLTFGNPIFEQLLASVEDHPEGGRTEQDQPQGIGLYRASEPAPVSLFFAPRDGELTTVEDLAGLKDAMLHRERRWSADEESEASAIFSRRRRGVLRQQTEVEQRRRRSRRSALVESARLLLLQASRVEQARARRPGLFEAPRPVVSGAEAVRALARHGDPFASLLRLFDAQDGTAQDDAAQDDAAQDDAAQDDAAQDGAPVTLEDPFERRLQGKSLAHLDRLWNTLTSTASSLLDDVETLQQRIEATETSVVEPSAGGLLERLWFPLTDGEDEAPTDRSELLSPDSVRPFVDGVPFYDDLRILVERLRDHEGDPQRAERERPGDFRWLALEGRFTPRPGLCVVEVDVPSMGRVIPPRSRCLLRLAPGGPWQGKLLLLEHPEIEDGELGGSFTLRRYESRVKVSKGNRFDESVWQAPQVVLHAAPSVGSLSPQVIEEVEEGSLWVIAEVLDVLS